MASVESPVVPPAPGWARRLPPDEKVFLWIVLASVAFMSTAFMSFSTTRLPTSRLSTDILLSALLWLPQAESAAMAATDTAAVRIRICMEFVPIAVEAEL